MAAEGMSIGAFVTFSLLTQRQHRRTLHDEGDSKKRDQELEHSFVRSQNAKHFRTRNQHTRKRTKQATAKFPGEAHGGALPTLRTLPSYPYTTLLEHEAVQFYFSQNILFLGRNDGHQGTLFWYITVPQLAWQYASVRYALVALALGTQALVRNYVEQLPTNTLCQDTLKYQNKAISHLVKFPIPSSIMSVAAILFRAICLVGGDVDGANRHSLAASRIVHEVASGDQGSSTPMIEYVRTVSGTDYTLLEPIQCSVERRPPPAAAIGMLEVPPGTSTFDCFRAAASDLIPDPVISQGVRHASWRQSAFFESLLQLAVAQRELHRIYDRIHTVQVDQYFQQPSQTGRVRSFISIVLENIDWVYAKWTSDSYLTRYLIRPFIQQILGLGQLLDDSVDHRPSSLLAAIELASEAPFIAAIKELAYGLGMTPLSPNQNIRGMGRLQLGTFGELASKLLNEAHLLLAVAAGDEPQLQRDIVEMIITGWWGHLVGTRI